MRHSRRKPSLVAAILAIALGAGLLVGMPAVTDTRHVDSPRPLGEPAGVQMENVSLREVPNAVVDLATSGLADLGITLPPVNIAGLSLPDVDVPVPSGVLPRPSTGAPSSRPSGTRPSSTRPTTRSPGSTPSSTAPSGTTSPSTRSAADASVGVLVKRVTSRTPFTMVGFTWNNPVAGSTMLMRTRATNGRWGRWIELEPLQTGRRPTADHPGGTEPVWVGDARELELAVADNRIAIPAAESTGDSLVDRILGAGSQALQALLGTTLPQLSVTLLNPESLFSLGSSMLTTLSGGPQVIPRAAWGADESIRCSQPTYSPALRGAIVHHTASSNDYTPQQSARIVRGIYAYHARTLHWCDIGYNALVDKYGQIFEGAFGGLDRNVEGTHTGGFNKETVGVSMIGNYDAITPPGALIASVARFLKWRLGVAGLDPNGTATLTAEAFTGSRFAAGTHTTLPMIAGHRDYNTTSCPGKLGYAALPQIRALAGGTGTGSSDDTPTTVTTAPTATPSPTPDAEGSSGTPTTSSPAPAATTPAATPPVVATTTPAR
ncbi:MAG: N-acetylmuramoyl-L-alanine amidase [Gordonia sp. (in: high G+C Gram-positive bacteria)]